ASLEGKQGKECVVAFSPDGTMMASGGSNKAVSLWSLRTACRPKQDPFVAIAKNGDAAKKDNLEGKPDPFPPGRHDSVVMAVLKETSDVYHESGFKAYKFGSSQKQIEQVAALSSKPNTNWLVNNQNEEFLFVDDCLRGFHKQYVDNVDERLSMLFEVFG